MKLSKIDAKRVKTISFEKLYPCAYDQKPRDLSVYTKCSLSHDVPNLIVPTHILFDELQFEVPLVSACKYLKRNTLIPRGFA